MNTHRAVRHFAATAAQGLIGGITPAVRTSLTATAVALCLITTPAVAGEDGKAVYDEHCAKCHNGGIGGWMSGAPSIKKKKLWSAVLPKGVDALTDATINGIGEMPPRGKCETCTDEQIRAAVEYLVDSVSN